MFSSFSELSGALATVANSCKQSRLKPERSANGGRVVDRGQPSAAAQGINKLGQLARMTDTAAQVFVKDLIAGDANSDVGVYSFRDFSVKNGPQAFSQDRNLPHPGRQSAPSCEIQEFRQTPAFPRMVQPMDFYG